MVVGLIGTFEAEGGQRTMAEDESADALLRYWAAVKEAEVTIAPFFTDGSCPRPSNVPSSPMLSTRSAWLKMRISPPSRPRAMPSRNQFGAPSNTENHVPRAKVGRIHGADFCLTRRTASEP
jgi:hypothetical protein